MSQLAKDITEYLTGERRAMTEADLIRSISIDASRNPQWPTASWQQWQQAIASAITEGLLVSDGHLLRVAPPKVQEPQSSQLDLF